jgi:O-antigen ligase
MQKLIQRCKTSLLSLWLALSPDLLNELLAMILLIMLPIGYLESLRWPFPGPKATHGIIKGLAVVIFCALPFIRLKLPKVKYAGQLFLVMIWFLSYTVSTAFTQDLGASMLHMWYPFICLILTYVFSIIQVKRKHFLLFLSIAVLLVTITFLFSFFSIIFRYSVDNIYYFIFLDERANFLLDEIRKYGKYASLGPYIMLVPATFYFMVDKASPLYKKLLSFVMLMMALITAVISNNRIDVLVFGIQWLVFMIFVTKRQAVLMTAPSIFAIIFGLFVTQLYFGFNLEQRILRPAVERDQETVTARFTYWATALGNFRNFPWFGTGPNTYNTVSDFPLRRYYVPGVNQYTIKQDYGIGIHNLFIERLSDTGLFGFLAFVTLLVYLLKQDVVRVVGLRKKGKEAIAKYIFISLASWSWILYGVTDNGYGAQGMVVFFFLRGLINHYETAILS